MSAIEALYNAVLPRLPRHMALGEFARLLAEWDVAPVVIAGETVGGVMVRGNEIHIGMTRCPASIRRAIRSMLAPIIERFGHAITTVAEDNARGLRFCERMGFVVEGKDNGIVRMRCERCNYA